jgi:sulfur carrier protein
MTDLVLTINGEPAVLVSGSTVADVVAHVVSGAEPKGIAVAVDRCVIPRSEWASTAVLANTHIEVVTAAAGG